MTTLNIPIQSLVDAMIAQRPWVGRTMVMRTSASHLSLQLVRFQRPVLVAAPVDGVEEPPVSAALPAVVAPPGTIELDVKNEEFSFQVPTASPIPELVTQLLATAVMARLPAPSADFELHPRNYVIAVNPELLIVQVDGTTVTAVVAIGSVDRTAEDA